MFVLNVQQNQLRLYFFVTEGFRAKIGIKGKAITKNGIKYMEVQTFKFGLSTTKLRVKLENLFNGDKALGEQELCF